MHQFQVSEYLQDILKKLSKKDKVLHERVLNKMKEIINSYEIEHYKNLMYDMKDSKEVHIGHFVLVFQYNSTLDMINFDDFDHHDKIFGK
jgi:mRNA-degrading endonuclease RelE of RelBE toxin-antitoxin system